MATQKKIDTVLALTEKVSKSKSIIFTDYRGIKHKQLEELRKSLKKVQGEYVISKNRLMLRALGEHAEALKPYLNDQTAALFSYVDEVTPLKELLKFFKVVTNGSAKAGLVGATVMNDTEVARLAQLPSRDVLLGKLAGQLMAPISGLHNAMSWNLNKLVWGLNAVKAKKQ